MLGKTHLAFGLGLTSCGIYLLETFHQPLLSPQNLALFYGAVGIGTLLPDIDEPQSIIGKKTMGISNFIKFIFGHRGFTHSLCFVLFLGILLFILHSLGILPIFLIIVQSLSKSTENIFPSVIYASPNPTFSKLMRKRLS